MWQVEEVEPEASLELPNIGGEGGYFDHDEVTGRLMVFTRLADLDAFLGCCQLGLVQLRAGCCSIRCQSG